MNFNLNQLLKIILRRIRVFFFYIKKPNKYRYLKFYEIINYIKYIVDFPFLIRKIVTKIKKTENFSEIYLENIKSPIYWPNEFKMMDFYQIIGEIMYEQNWHYYEAYGTKIEEGEVIIDCGASEGLFGLKHINNAKYIYLIEPLPIFINVLKKTFKPYKNCKILPYGLADKNSTSYISKSSVMSSIQKNFKHGVHRVQNKTLDHLFLNQDREISYIKADIEGDEYKMLSGAKKIIKKWNPKLAIACYHKGNNAMQIIKLIHSINPSYKYRLKGIEPISGKPIIIHCWI